MKFKSPYIAFSAPSGAGKTTIVENLARRYDELVISVSATTRPPRPGEINGQAYFFLTKKEFEQAIANGEFLEYEHVHNEYYGTLKKCVQHWIGRGKTVLFDIDVNGALAIKKQFPGAILIFIHPPSEDELRKRLKKRSSESDESISLRLKRLSYEFDCARSFDHIIINDDLQKAIEEVEQIIIAGNAHETDRN